MADVNQNQRSQLKQLQKENSMNKKSIPIAVRHGNAQTLFEAFKKLTGEKVTFSKSRGSDVSFCRGFWFLMFAAANIDYWFLLFLQLFLLAASSYFAAVLKNCI